MNGGAIAAIERDTIAEALGLRPGDVLLQVNGHPLRDVLDVQFYAAEEELDLLIHRGDEDILYQIERDYDVPLGLSFASPTFDGMRRCQNRCEFCFVAQMPPGLRRSLYVRDDDYRYSVLYGSFVTLTNLTAQDWERLAEQRLSPLYVSVQATEPSLRHQLLGRRDVPEILVQIDRLSALGIEVHAQVVLIPGTNDGPHLIRTLADLADRYPTVQSIGIVPVGLTRYHRGRCRPYTPQEGRAIIDQIAPLQAEYRARYGISLAYLADEWYLMTGSDLPTAEAYDGYPQVENGIGLTRQFLEDRDGTGFQGRKLQIQSCTLVCGMLIAPLMRRTAEELASQTGVRVDVVPVVNHLFGEWVTVSGLLSAQDVVEALRGRDLGQIVFLPEAMFAVPPSNQKAILPQDVRNESIERTLDDWTAHDLAERLGRPVVMANRLSQVWDALAGA